MKEVTGCPGASKALAIINEMKSAGARLVVCKDEDQAKFVSRDLKTLSKDPVLFISDTETLPYDLETPHSHIRASRINALSQIALGNFTEGFVVCSEQSAAKKVAGKSFWESHRIQIEPGTRINPDQFENELARFGYLKEELDLSDYGDFVRNANVFDIFSTGEDAPVRIFIDEEVVKSIVEIDLETNRKQSELEKATILPTYEFETNESALRNVRGMIRSHTLLDPNNDPVFSELKEGKVAGGLEYYLTELCSETDSLLGMMSQAEEFNLCFVENEGSAYWKQAEKRYREITEEMGRVAPDPESLWVTPEEIDQWRKEFCRLRISRGPSDYAFSNKACRQPNLMRTSSMMKGLFDQATTLVISASSSGRSEQIKQILSLSDIEEVVEGSPPSLNGVHEGVFLIKGFLSQGFIREEGEKRIVAISDREIFGTSILENEKVKSRTVDFQKIQDLENLRIGDPIVHLEAGVGRFAGLQKMDRGGQEEEFLKITYKDEVTTFVPMNELYMVSRFGGLETETAPLDIMGSKKWRRNLLLSVADIEQTAKALVAIREERESVQGEIFSKPGFQYHRFCDQFEFEPTEDQHKAFQDVTADLTDKKPMDRLIVGDVGFGKTEVALRAAFHTCENGFNVIVAAPTTILSGQHFETFKERFKGFDFNIVNAEDNKPGNIQRLIESEVPTIVIGTHRVLRMKDKIDDIGLYVIDEEHRFGTRDKEIINTVHGKSNVLNMTATPIPRTLTLSLSGIRDISVIGTAPSKRLAVRTLMAMPKEATYREAIDREMMRNGQVYVLHNNTQTLDDKAEELKRIAPEAKIATLHGKMKDEKQRNVLLKFARHEIDILICTTVIEIGIDVPTANTILIDQPERLGLSQLHQVRGRVGRSDRQGYAYLLTDPKSTPKSSLQRFQALISARRLGDGFLLASHDLEIRGAGELLGEKQSGHIYTIGFSLYSKILMRAVRMVEEGKSVSGLLDRDRKIDLNLNCSGYIESHYIDKEQLRLTFYKRLASAETLNEIREIEEELIDRFGAMPQITANLISMTKIRLFSRLIGVSRAILEQSRGYIEAQKNTQEDLYKAIRQVAVDSEYKGKGIRFFYPMGDVEKRFGFMIQIMYAMKNQTNQKAVEAA